VTKKKGPKSPAAAAYDREADKAWLKENPPAPEPRVIDDRLRQDAKFLLHDEQAMEAIETHRRFLVEHIGQGQSIWNDRQDIAGLRFITEVMSVLHRVAGMEDE
jgi:hypothetical protein